MQLRRKGVATAALAGAVVAIAIVVGGIAYYIGQSGSSPPSVVTNTMTTTVTGAGTLSATTLVATSTGVVTTITSTATATSTVRSTATATTSLASTVLNCAGIPVNCVEDFDVDGV